MGRNLRIILLLVLTVIPAYLTAAFELFPLAPLNTARGLMILNGATTPGGLFNDPASIPLQAHPALALNRCNRFALKNLDQNYLTLVWPRKGIGLGGGFSRFGNRHYQEVIWSLLAGKQLPGRLRLGLGLIGYRLTIGGYGSSTSYGFVLGWQIDLNPGLRWGGALRNINAPLLGAAGESLPQVVVTGFQARIGEQLHSQVEWEQDTAFPGRLKFGIQVDLLPGLQVAAGYAANPGQATAGFRFHLVRLSIDYAIASHPQLGFSQWMGLSIHLPEP